MSQIVFAGTSVGQKGVQPDLQKLTAIVNWKIPENATALAGFLGLTGWFRDLIPGYAKKEQPLRDLLRNVELPEKYTKTIYRRIMSNFKLKDIWTASDRHTKAFLDLKAEITGEPVLRGPKWDRSPFIITTDGSQDAWCSTHSKVRIYTAEWEGNTTPAPTGLCIQKNVKNRREVQTVLTRICCTEVRLRQIRRHHMGLSH
jgi:hypothetical protein